LSYSRFIYSPSVSVNKSIAKLSLCSGFLALNNTFFPINTVKKKVLLSLPDSIFNQAFQRGGYSNLPAA
ncbi:MAG: hypothetical protein P8J44_00015, partial [Gammaproteobacteria bacterium]|nr:hypothetical protein [Gammaproteobacteria bacterium]